MKSLNKDKKIILLCLFIPLLFVAQYYVFKVGVISPMIKGVNIKIIEGEYIQDIDKYVVKLGDDVVLSAGDYIKIPQQEKIYTPSNSTAIKGIDLSYHQNNIDWQKVKNSGIKFVIIRGGYSTIEDKNFKTHMEGALNVGLDVGVYWYSKAYTLEGAKSEAKKCMEVVSPYKDKLSFPIYLY